MQYLLLIYGDESAQKNATQADMNAMFSAYRDFTQSLITNGQMKAGDALQPTTTATTACGSCSPAATLPSPSRRRSR